MKIGDSIELIIDNLDHQGRGVSKQLDKVIFVPNALPGECVNVRIDKIKKNIVEAHVESFLQSSDERINSVCPHFSKCGGCDLMHLTYDKQLAFKERKIEEIMHKFCNYQFKINPIVKSEHQEYYRNKVTFQIDNVVGFYERGTNKIVPVNNCKIINQKANDLLKRFNTSSFIEHIKKVMIRNNSVNEILLVIETDNKISSDVINETFKDEADSIVINGKVTLGTGKILEQLNKYKFIVSPKSFFQVNTKQTVNLYNLIKKYAALTKDDILFDLYCGTGTIGIYLSEDCQKVIGIEINKSAIDDANKNKDINNITNIEFICGDALKQISKSKIKPDVIVVDPPRAGLDKKDILNILELKAKRIVYVSCDPVTLARDLNILGKDYEIKELTPVDMFPNTSHVECVSVLKLRKPL